MELRDSTERAFEAYGEPFEILTACKCLVRVMTAEDCDWPAVLGNLCKERNSWGQLSWILSREGADPKVSGQFFKQ